MNIFQFFTFLHFKLRLLVSLKCWSICHRRILTIKRCGSRCGSTTDRIVSKHNVSASIIMNNLLNNLPSRSIIKTARCNLVVQSSIASCVSNRLIKLISCRIHRFDWHIIKCVICLLGTYWISAIKSSRF